MPTQRIQTFSTFSPYPGLQTIVTSGFLHYPPMNMTKVVVLSPIFHITLLPKVTKDLSSENCSDKAFASRSGILGWPLSLGITSHRQCVCRPQPWPHLHFTWLRFMLLWPIYYCQTHDPSAKHRPMSLCDPITPHLPSPNSRYMDDIPKGLNAKILPGASCLTFTFFYTGFQLPVATWEESFTCGPNPRYTCTPLFRDETDVSNCPSSWRRSPAAWAGAAGWQSLPSFHALSDTDRATNTVNNTDWATKTQSQTHRQSH